MDNNRKLMLYTAPGRTAQVLQAAPTDVLGLFARLQQSQALPATHDVYTALPKARQDAIKDVGAYIAGELRGGRRKAGSVISRCAAVLDADNLPPGSTDEFIRRVEGLGLCYCIHSTAKHSSASPRLRAVIPFGKDIPAEQYAPIVRLLCQMIQPEMSWFDPSTDQAGRIMYWPTHCQDIAPVWDSCEETRLLDTEKLLARFTDWHDVTAWPGFPREQAPANAAAKQTDPTEKVGIVGTFCRCYDVTRAMENLLPGVYEPAGAGGRYTFTGGSTYGGAVVYEGGKFLYSHHATDPAGGQLVNAFDLVRLHRFGALDDDVNPQNRGNRRPSYLAMCKYAEELPEVAGLLRRETAEHVKAAFGNTIPNDAAAEEMADAKGKQLTLSVMETALDALGLSVRYNLLIDESEIHGLPECYSPGRAAETLPTYVADYLKVCGVKGISKQTVLDYLDSIADASRYNPIAEFLTEGTWDDQDRIMPLYEILGVTEPKYQTYVRKWLIQCVALGLNSETTPVGAEGVLVLQGPQGIAKTSFFRLLTPFPRWFVEGAVIDMTNKDTQLRAQRGWITELGELDSTMKKEQVSLKAYVTSPEDRIRRPYGRSEVRSVRRTSFCGTVNPQEYLRDETGARRFWTVPVTKIDKKTLFALSREWVQQLWYQVYQLYAADPRGFRLTDAEIQQIMKDNEAFSVALPGEIELLDALDFNIPRDHWVEKSPGEIRDELFRCTASPQQISRVLRKLEQDGAGITHRAVHNHRTLYCVPLRSELFPMNEGGGLGDRGSTK